MSVGTGAPCPVSALILKFCGHRCAGASRRVRFTRREFGGTRPPFFFSPSLSSPENWIPFVSSEVSLSSHSCLGLFQNEQNGSGWWGRGARNKLRTHTHIYTLSHTHTATARPFSKPTDKCTTLSHYSPINIGATAANSC